MHVLRIVPNLPATADAGAGAADSFYRGILGLDVAMDHGWIRTYAAAGARMRAQVSVATEGGAGTAVPALSIEVDDLDEVLRRVRAAGLAIEYGPAREPWGVRRFYVRDPLGTLVNILQHDPHDS